MRSRTRRPRGAESDGKAWRCPGLPAGTGPHLVKASRGFQVVAAYPERGTYDECTNSRNRLDAMKRIAKVLKPDRESRPRKRLSDDPTVARGEKIGPKRSRPTISIKVSSKNVLLASDATSHLVAGRSGSRMIRAGIRKT